MLNNEFPCEDCEATNCDGCPIMNDLTDLIEREERTDQNGSEDKQYPH
jgi:hypothetical protein